VCCLVLNGCPQLLDDDFQRRLESDRLVSGAGADAGVGGAGDIDVGGRGGVGGSGGSAAAGGAGGSAGSGAAGSGGSGTLDPVVPVVVASVPADGATGVAADAEIVLTFSAPMDTASVQAAYSSSSLPAAQVSFAWSAGDTVLHIVPSAALEVVSGSDPNAVVARQYALDIAAQAQDKLGHSLAPAHVGFSVVRSITQTLGAVQSRDLTGNWRTDSSYGLAFCEQIDTTFCMGDTPAVGPGYRGFLTFDLAALSPELSALSAAELSATVQQKFGTPFTDLGVLRSEHVVFSVIGDEAFAAAGLSAARTLGTSADVGSVLSTDVLSDVQADWSVRGQSQFRLSFVSDTDLDTTADMLVFDWSSALLTLTYLAP
jgi:hypothetical protein